MIEDIRELLDTFGVVFSCHLWRDCRCTPLGFVCGAWFLLGGHDLGWVNVVLCGCVSDFTTHLHVTGRPRGFALCFGLYLWCDNIVVRSNSYHFFFVLCERPLCLRSTSFSFSPLRQS